MPLRADLQSLALPELVDLWTLDAAALGGSTLHFHAHTTTATLTFNGVAYTPFPIQISGLERTTKGAIPRPTLAVANIGGVISAILGVTGDLCGAKLTRTRTFSKYLDGEPAADPTQVFPLEVWYLDRKSSETRTAVQFEMAAAVDVEGVQLPRRQVTANICTWVYRGAECGYTGIPVTDVNGSPFGGALTTYAGVWNSATAYTIGQYVYVLTNGVRVYYVASTGISAGQATPASNANWLRDVCLKKLADCKAHFGTTSPLSFGGFPGTNRLPRG